MARAVREHAELYGRRVRLCSFRLTETNPLLDWLVMVHSELGARACGRGSVMVTGNVIHAAAAQLGILHPGIPALAQGAPAVAP